MIFKIYNSWSSAPRSSASRSSAPRSSEPTRHRYSASHLFLAFSSLYASFFILGVWLNMAPYTLLAR